MADDGLLLVFDENDEDVTRAGVDGWIRHLEAGGAPAQAYRLGTSIVLPVPGVDVVDAAGPDLPPPSRRAPRAPGAWLWRRELRPAGTTVTLGPTTIGDGTVAVIAGPCAVETPEQMVATAAAVAGHGAVGLRGGVFKPRTWPYSFQGLKWDGLDLLVAARERTGLPFITEVCEPEHVKRLAEVVDGFQIGTRNMQNFALLTAVGQSGLPVVLKRGFGCTVEEALAAAEYLLQKGNDQVVLCERGIRTFEPWARFTLDVTAVALWKERTHLPVMADPSHSGGRPELVEPLALAAIAAGADALLVDVHVRPEEALCDGAQALRPAQFAGLMDRLGRAAAGLGRRLAEPAATVPPAEGECA